MTVFQGYDGELRIYSDGALYGSEPSGTTYYFEILFCEMDMSVPIGKPRTEETLIMDRNRFDTNAHYVKGPDDPRYGPVNLTFSCRLADTVNTRILSDWFSGSSKITNAASGSTQIYSWDGQTTLDGNTLKAFVDVDKMAYRVECLWDGSTDYGVRAEEVYFPPDQQEIRESPDGLILSCNGLVYGDVTRITGFTAGTTSII
jgi:hypothetical protein